MNPDVHKKYYHKFLCIAVCFAWSNYLDLLEFCMKVQSDEPYLKVSVRRFEKEVKKQYL